MARIPRKSILGQCTSAGYGLQHLWERHKEIARLLVSGMTQQEIAIKLHFSESWLSIVCNSPTFKKYLEQLRGRVEVGLADVRSVINDGAVKSASLLINMLGDKSVSPSTQAKVAFDFLDRAGYGAVKTVRNENLTVTLTSDRLEKLREQRDKMLEQSRLEAGITTIVVNQ